MLSGYVEQHGMTDDMVADAVALRLSSAIEAVAACSDELRQRAFGDEWKVTWATRNRIAHNYAFVDLDVIRATIASDPPAFEAALLAELDGDR